MIVLGFEMMVSNGVGVEVSVGKGVGVFVGAGVEVAVCGVGVKVRVAVGATAFVSVGDVVVFAQLATSCVKLVSVDGRARSIFEILEHADNNIVSTHTKRNIIWLIIAMKYFIQPYCYFHHGFATFSQPNRRIPRLLLTVQSLE